MKEIYRLANKLTSYLLSYNSTLDKMLESGFDDEDTLWQPHQAVPPWPCSQRADPEATVTLQGVCTLVTGVLNMLSPSSQSGLSAPSWSTNPQWERRTPVGVSVGSGTPRGYLFTRSQSILTHSVFIASMCVVPIVIQYKLMLFQSVSAAMLKRLLQFYPKIRIFLAN